MPYPLSSTARSCAGVSNGNGRIAPVVSISATRSWGTSLTGATNGYYPFPRSAEGVSVFPVSYRVSIYPGVPTVGQVWPRSGMVFRGSGSDVFDGDGGAPSTMFFDEADGGIPSSLYSAEVDGGEI